LLSLLFGQQPPIGTASRQGGPAAAACDLRHPLGQDRRDGDRGSARAAQLLLAERSGSPRAQAADATDHLLTSFLRCQRWPPSRPADPGPPMAAAPGRAHPQLDAQLQELVSAVAPTLVALPGVGVDTAGQLLVTAGDNPQRLHGEAAFAHLCGTAPIPASSGRTHRHRLNRGGDRQANHALWRIALVRMRCHPPTRAYVERRTKQGLSKLDILRCLKRYIAREVYHHLASLPPSAATACPK
jgi:transposase